MGTLLRSEFCATRWVAVLQVQALSRHRGSSSRPGQPLQPRMRVSFSFQKDCQYKKDNCTIIS